MDVDYANSKGSYVMTRVAENMVLATSDIITWNDYRPEDEQLTFGLLSQISPDGRYVISTVKDKSVFVPRPDLAFSQLFFPIKGILCVYDRRTGSFTRVARRRRSGLRAKQPDPGVRMGSTLSLPVVRLIPWKPSRTEGRSC